MNNVTSQTGWMRIQSAALKFALQRLGMPDGSVVLTSTGTELLVTTRSPGAATTATVDCAGPRFAVRIPTVGLRMLCAAGGSLSAVVTVNAAALAVGPLVHAAPTVQRVTCPSLQELIARSRRVPSGALGGRYAVFLPPSIEGLSLRYGVRSHVQKLLTWPEPVQLVVVDRLLRATWPKLRGDFALTKPASLPQFSEAVATVRRADLLSAQPGVLAVQPQGSVLSGQSVQGITHVPVSPPTGPLFKTLLHVVLDEWVDICIAAQHIAVAGRDVFAYTTLESE